MITDPPQKFHVGDLVKIKWTTYAAKRRAKKFGRLTDDVGLVIELGHPMWDGRVMAPAHVKVEWSNCQSTWEVPPDMEIVTTA